MNSNGAGLILGIETSCDETAAAVVSRGERILSNVVLSQIPVHQIYGGVVPELASREHLRAIVPIVRQALERARVTIEDVDAVAVTHGPGLVGALLVGLTYAKSLAAAASKPLIAVNHLEGHIHAVLLQQRSTGSAPPEFPAATLVVSGGHTTLYSVDSAATALTYRTLGKTRDDAAGEAFDKVAKLLGLGYPGGPLIDKLADFGRDNAIPFTRVKLKGNQLDFSFSGIKTAVLRYIQTHDMAAQIQRRQQAMKDIARPTLEQWKLSCEPETLDLIASFQRAVCVELAEKTAAAADQIGARSIFVSGGVAANRRLRRELERVARAEGLPVFAPALSLCTDNAAMIAAAAYPKWLACSFAGNDTAAHAQLAIENADPVAPGVARGN